MDESLDIFEEYTFELPVDEAALTEAFTQELFDRLAEIETLEDAQDLCNTIQEIRKLVLELIEDEAKRAQIFEGLDAFEKEVKARGRELM